MIQKIIYGFVIQHFDEIKQHWVSQDFTVVPDRDIEYEDENGNTLDPITPDVEDLEPDMVQPCDRQKCVQVEYDETYFGGDYSKVGEYAHIPHDVLDRCPSWGLIDPVKGHAGAPEEQRLKYAFYILTGIDPKHIIHYTFDEVYDQFGNEWRE
jgi:hypothetical protein